MEIFDSSKRLIHPARAADVLVEEVGDETVVYDLKTKEAHCLKPLAAFAFAHADGKRTLDELVQLAQRTLTPAPSATEVSAVVAELERSSLLDVPQLSVQHGTSRREMLRNTAMAGAAATISGAFVTTVAAPAAWAATCYNQPGGCSCDPHSGTAGNHSCLLQHCCGSSQGTDVCNIGCCSVSNNGTDCKCSSILGTCNTLPTPPGGAGCCQGVCLPSTQGAAC